MKEGTGKKSKKAKEEKPNPAVQVSGRAYVSEGYIDLNSANHFEAIRGDRHVIHDKSSKYHIMVIEGVIYRTPDLGLDYADLLSLVNRGLATGEKPTYEQTAPSTHRDGIAISERAWNNKFENIRKSRKGNPSYLSTEWLFATDFKSESDYITATNKGYFSMKDYKAGEKGEFSNGPHFYFARQIGLDATESMETLNLGIGNLDDYRFLKKGKFDTREQAQDARDKGFRFKKKYLAAMEMGCSSKDQYLAIVKHGWENLPSFKEAEKVGFKPNESELYRSLRKHQFTTLTLAEFSLTTIPKHLTLCAIIGPWWTSNMKLDMTNCGKQKFLICLCQRKANLSPTMIFSKKRLNLTHLKGLRQRLKF